MGADLKGRGLTVTDHSLLATVPPLLFTFQVLNKSSILKKAGSMEWIAHEFIPFVSFHYFTFLTFNFFIDFNGF